MGSKKTTEQTYNNTQTAAPPTFTMPGIEIASKAVTDALAANASKPAYAGDFVAAFDPSKATGAYNTAAKQIGQLGDFAQGQTTDLFKTKDLSAEVQAAIQAGIDPVYRQLVEQVLPGITNSALQSGAYTNDRALGIEPGLAIRDFTENAQRIGATMTYDALQREEDRRIERAGLLPSLTDMIGRLRTAPGDLYSESARLTQAAKQAALDNAIAKAQYSTTAPYENIAPAVDLLTQLSAGWGTQTGSGQSTTVESSSGLGQVLQGVAGIAAGAAGLGAFGPLGAAAKVAAPAAAAATNQNAALSRIFG